MAQTMSLEVGGRDEVSADRDVMTGVAVEEVVEFL